MNKRVDPAVYTKEYYLKTCLGSEEFRKSYGIKSHSRVNDLLSQVNIKQGMKILDIGCGRGDYSFYCAQKGAEVIGADYSKDAIEIANLALQKQEKKVRDNIVFMQIDAKDMHFNKDQFDLVISIDFFEHVIKEDLELIMQKLSKCLKKDGLLLIHTEANKIYLDFTHKFYSYPISSALILMNRILNGTSYPNIPREARNELHKVQHVNEPTYYYLRKLFKRHKFVGKIYPKVGYLKSSLSWKDKAYNFFVLLYPLSSFFPLHYLFAYHYVCIMKNTKS